MDDISSGIEDAAIRAFFFDPSRRRQVENAIAVHVYLDPQSPTDVKSVLALADQAYELMLHEPSRLAVAVLPHRKKEGSRKVTYFVEDLPEYRFALIVNMGATEDDADQDPQITTHRGTRQKRREIREKIEAIRAAPLLIKEAQEARARRLQGLDTV